MIESTRCRKPYLWLASYPKSGNTWTRIFMHAYQSALQPSAQLFSLNELPGNYLASRLMFETISGIDAPLIPPDQLRDYRNQALSSPVALQLAGDLCMVKVHDQYKTPDNVVAVPRVVSKGVVYLVRNPLDIVASWAYHRQQSLADTVGFINNADAQISVSDFRQTYNLPQYLGDWSGHVSSWINQTDIPLLCLRYEDLLDSPLQSFSRLVAFSGLPLKPEIIEQVIEQTRFSNLKRQESATGFRELPKAATIPSFFRQGKAGEGERELSQELQQKIRVAHHTMMRQFNYL